MKEYDVVLTKRAKTDIIDIGDYIAYTLLEPETIFFNVSALWRRFATFISIHARSLLYAVFSIFLFFSYHAYQFSTEFITIYLRKRQCSFDAIANVFHIPTLLVM